MLVYPVSFTSTVEENKFHNHVQVLTTQLDGAHVALQSYINHTSLMGEDAALRKEQ